MANERNLLPSHPGNSNAARHGLYSASGRLLAPRAEEIADALMQLAHTVPVDRIAAEEIGALLARIEAPAARPTPVQLGIQGPCARCD